MRVALMIVSACLAHTIWAVSASSADIVIDWKIKNNFRIIDGADAQQNFFADIERKRRCAQSDAGCPLEKTAKVRCTRNNYCTVFNAAYLSYPGNWYADPRRVVQLSTKTPSKLKDCTWFEIKPRNEGSTQRIIIGNKRLIEVKFDVGKHLLEVQCAISSGKLISSGQQEIDIRDIKMIALGDSFMSGEGSPQLTHGRHVADAVKPGQIPEDSVQNPAQWLEHRCHRSLFSSTALAAANLAENNPKLSVTYFNVACSGAEIKEGILTPYRGRVRPDQLEAIYNRYGKHTPKATWIGPYIKPQILQIRDVICRNDICTPPDYLFVLTGGNELGFGPMVAKFATGCGKDCLESSRREIKDKLKALTAQYDDLRDQLKAIAPPQNTILLEYPNPLQNEHGVACRDTFFNGNSFVPGLYTVFGAGINTAASRFGQDEVLRPLNSLLTAVACKNSWRHVASIEQVSRKSGYCAKGRWFNNIRDSLAKQDAVPSLKSDDAKMPDEGLPTGAMHPNLIGQINIAAEISYEFVRDNLLPLKDKAKMPTRAACPSATSEQSAQN